MFNRKKNAQATLAPVHRPFVRAPEIALAGSNGEEDLTEAAADLRTDTQLQTYQVSIGTAPTPIAIRPDGWVTVQNLGSNDVYLGGTGVSVTNGFLLPGTGGAVGGASHRAVRIKGNGDIYGVAAVSGSVCVAVGEEVVLD